MIHFNCKLIMQGPVVQSNISQTMSLRRHRVKYMPTIHYQIHCYFLLKKSENLLIAMQNIFPTKNNSVFVIFTFRILMKHYLTMSLISNIQPLKSEMKFLFC